MHLKVVDKHNAGEEKTSGSCKFGPSLIACSLDSVVTICARLMPLFVTHMQRLQLKQTVFPYQLNVPSPNPVTAAPFPIQMLRVRLGVLQKRRKRRVMCNVLYQKQHNSSSRAIFKISCLTTWRGIVSGARYKWGDDLSLCCCFLFATSMGMLLIDTMVFVFYFNTF